jgi:prepilin-type N-terminal cleavage/methylation domain-containing protein
MQKKILKSGFTPTPKCTYRKIWIGWLKNPENNLSQSSRRKLLVRGFTLIEMLVAIALFLLGTQATVLIFSKTMKSKAYSMEMGKSAFVVSRSIGDVTRYLRRARQSDNGAYPIVSISDNDLVIYSDYDKDNITERLHIYFVDANDTVYMGVREPSAGLPPTYANGDGETFVLAEHIVNTTSDPMFSYYNMNYPADTNTESDKSKVRLIKIFLKINIDPNNAPDNIQQETFVELRNLNDYDRIH